MTLKLFRLLMFLKGKALHIFLCFVLIFAFCFKDSVPSANALGAQDDLETADEDDPSEDGEAITVFGEEAPLSAVVKKLYTYSLKTDAAAELPEDTAEEITEATAAPETETEEKTPYVEEETAPIEEETVEEEIAEFEENVDTEEVTEAEEIVSQTATEEIIVTTAPQESSGTSLSLNGQYGQRYQEQWEIDYANQLFDLVNDERAKYGIAPLKKMDVLTAAATERAWEVSRYNSHTRPDGTSCFTVLTQYGLSLSSRAENIAYYSRTPQAAFNSLMGSYSHREPMLNSKFEYMGVGFYCVYDDAGGHHYYWTQLFYTP